MEALLRRLRKAGLSAETTDHAYHALDSHTIGFTLARRLLECDGADPSMSAGSIQEIISGYPYLLEHAQQNERQRRPDEAPAYEFGLDLILDSLERMLAAG